MGKLPMSCNRAGRSRGLSNSLRLHSNGFIDRCNSPQRTRGRAWVLVLASARMIEVTSPFPVVSLPSVWRWVEAVRGRIADDSFAKDIDSFVDMWLQQETIPADQRRTWAVRKSGELGGVL